MPSKQAEKVKTMLTSLILIRGRWWCPVELPPVGLELPWQTGTVPCLPGWRLISDSDTQGRSLPVNYFSPSSPNLTQIWQELSGARIAGAAVITRTWAALNSATILFLLSHGHLHSCWFNAQLPLDLWWMSGCQSIFLFWNEEMWLTMCYCLYPVWRQWVLWVRGSREAQGRCPVMSVLSHKSFQHPAGWLCGFGDITREVKATFGASMIHTLYQAARLPGSLLWDPETWLIS